MRALAWVAEASGSAESSGTKVARSRMPRAVQGEESIGHSNGGKSERLPQHQLLKQRAVLEALFVPPFSQSKSHSYPGTPLSLRKGVVNRSRGRSAYSSYPSAKKRAERHGQQLSSRTRHGRCFVSKAQ